MRGDLGWLKRIMFLLPIFLCLTITNIVIIKNTRVRYAIPVRSEKSKINNTLQRGLKKLDGLSKSLEKDAAIEGQAE